MCETQRKKYTQNLSGLDEKVAEKRITTFAEFARLFLGYVSDSRQVIEVYVIIINGVSISFRKSCYT